MTMPKVLAGGFPAAILPTRLGNPQISPSFYSAAQARRPVVVTRSIRASSAVVSGETQPMAKGPIAVVEEENRSVKNILACPICYNSLASADHSHGSVDSTLGSWFRCNCCAKNYSEISETYLDLTLAGPNEQYAEPATLTTGVIQASIDLIPLRERLAAEFRQWRLPRAREREFEMAKDYLKPVLGGNIVDASCGSGMFSRLFARTGLFSSVIAMDYSENMLQQCNEYMNQGDNIPTEKILLVRADISRLPFLTGSVDAVHAGAALHCWPSPALGVAEISRVLRPGGVFVATTFLYESLSSIPFAKNISKEMSRCWGFDFFLSERELEDICRACGLVGFTCVKKGLFIMISATKPK